MAQKNYWIGGNFKAVRPPVKKRCAEHARISRSGGARVSRGRAPRRRHGRPLTPFRSPPTFRARPQSHRLRRRPPSRRRSTSSTRRATSPRARVRRRVFWGVFSTAAFPRDEESHRAPIAHALNDFISMWETDIVNLHRLYRIFSPCPFPPSAEVVIAPTAIHIGSVAGSIRSDVGVALQDIHTAKVRR
jgi:hypothetical protein